MGLRVVSVLFGVLLAATCVLAQETRAEKLDVSFYITSLCSDTRRFITLQVAPVYEELKANLSVSFVPWGKTRREADGSLTCQFGPDDCAANRLQSCVLDQLVDDQQKIVDYMNCEFLTLASTTLDYTCVREAGLSEAAVKQCFDSPLADGLQLIAQKRTSEITMVFVPTIVFNSTYSVENQNAAFADFRGFVCDLLQETNPSACS